MAESPLDVFVAKYLPIARFMGLRMADYDGQSLTVKAPLAPNINDKQTAFGGSLYCSAVMACWGMVYMRCIDYGLEPDIVVVKADIEYLRPVPGEIRARSLPVEENRWNLFFSRYEDRGRAKIELSSEILVEGEQAVRFQGQYAIVGQK